MTYARRVLNVLATMSIVLAAIGLSLYALMGIPQSSVPLSFFGFLLAAPGCAHIASALLSWERRTSALQPNRAILGLGLSVVSCFVWFVLSAVGVELSLKRGLPAGGLELVVLVAGGGILLLAAFLNVLYFRRVLLASSHHVREV